MPPSHDPAREHRILDEIIVDCYDEEEELMGRYYYMTDNLEFPITATARMPLRGGTTEEKTEQIVEVDPKSETGSPIRLGVAEEGSERIHHISPADLVRLDTTPENLEIINDWLYWHDFELLH
ncbi:MAG: hypothetical protein KIS77_02930 [Saprospiraceae bacterium]|nr:hypothetical protein [Saprospiraceae bacterium]